MDLHAPRACGPDDPPCDLQERNRFVSAASLASSPTRGGYNELAMMKVRFAWGSLTSVFVCRDCRCALPVSGKEHVEPIAQLHHSEDLVLSGAFERSSGRLRCGFPQVPKGKQEFANGSRAVRHVKKKHVTRFQHRVERGTRTGNHTKPLSC